jgi:hypothetical protein
LEINGEDHEVVLVWSLKSGKIRIYWNRRDISYLFPTPGKSVVVVNFAWETRTHERMQVLAHSESTPGSVQYDLLIDGVSFFRLPSRDVVDRTASKRLAASSLVGPSSTDSGDGSGGRPLTDALPCEESRADSTSELSDDATPTPDPNSPHDNLGWRLSLAGFNAGASARDTVDELHSDVYSTMVESLRTKITEHLPQTEGLVSRAIIRAFFPDNDSETSPSYDSLSINDRDPQQVEVDCISRTEEWARLNVEVAPSLESEDKVLRYFQKHVEKLFSYVRNEELVPEDACRILLNVAAILQLDFARPLLGDTVVIKGLGKMESLEFSSMMESYGAIQEIGFAKFRGLGFCRFAESSALQLLKSAFASGRAFPGHELAQMTVTSEMVEKKRAMDSVNELPARIEVSEGSTEDEPFLVGPRGGFRIPHLMASHNEDSILVADPDFDPPVYQGSVADSWIDTCPYNGMKMPRIVSRQVSPDSVTHIRRHTIFSDGADIREQPQLNPEQSRSMH